MKSPPSANAALMAPLVISAIASGCFAQSEGGGDPSLPLKWNFELRNATWQGFASMEFAYRGSAIGPDLDLHPADVYSLFHSIELPQGTVQFNWSVAHAADDARLLSAYSSCIGFQESDDGSLHCSDAEELRIPTSDEALFFGAPLVLPHIPSGGGDFGVQVWDAGVARTVLFASRAVGDIIEVWGDGIAVEHGHLEPRGSSSGAILDCDVFEGDVLLVSPKEVGCRESEKGWEWWTSLPVPEATPGTRRANFSAPVQAAHAPHGVPTGTETLPFPITEAVEVAISNVPQVRDLTSDPTWRLGYFTVSPTERVQLGPVSCSTFGWVLGFATASGNRAAATASKQVCADSLDAGNEASSATHNSTRWPSSERVTPLDSLFTLTTETLFCSDDSMEDLRFSLFTRGYSAGNRSWLTIGGGIVNGVTVDAASGFLATLVRSRGDGVLGSLFREGTTHACL